MKGLIQTYYSSLMTSSTQSWLLRFKTNINNTTDEFLSISWFLPFISQPVYGWIYLVCNLWPICSWIFISHIMHMPQMSLSLHSSATDFCGPLHRHSTCIYIYIYIYTVYIFLYPISYRHSLLGFNFFPYGCFHKMYVNTAGLLHWHWGMIAPVPVKQPWRIWVKVTYTKPQHNITQC